MRIKKILREKPLKFRVLFAMALSPALFLASFLLSLVKLAKKVNQLKIL